MKKTMTLIAAVALTLIAGFAFADESKTPPSAEQLSLPGIVIEDFGSLQAQTRNQVDGDLQTRIESEFDKELTLRLESRASELLERLESAPDALASQITVQVETNTHS